MRILHVSDTHGLFNWSVPRDIDLIIHTGDMLPNRTRGVRPVEMVFQANWVKQNIEHFKRLIGDKPFLFVPGNHDYADPTPILRHADIYAVNLHVDGPIWGYRGVAVYGFPYVPEYSREWNFELDAVRMWQAVARLKDALDGGEVDIIAAHAPIYGVLDVTHERDDDIHAGSAIMRQVLEDVKTKPKWFLHGHIHSSPGITVWNGITVSNAALTQHVIDI